MSSVIEILNNLDKSEQLKELVLKGILSYTLLSYRDIYNEYDVYRRLGNNVAESVLLVSVKLNVSERTVYTAIKRMEE